ncbi:MAG: serine hydrolase, partial [Acidobacteria bacterium]|nr:serine hydrolase [Acidobacteriota bacterium]
MRSVLVTAVATTLLFGASAGAQQKETFDYWQQQRRMVRQGQQAILMCNGLFTSNRTIEQVFAQELAFLPEPVGTAAGGGYEVDERRKAVTVGAGHGAPRMRAAFRDGIGCVILAPDQTLDDIDSLPSLALAPPPGEASAIAWPDGDKLASNPLPSYIDQAALRAASDWSFDRASPEQVTLSLLVVHRGRIIHERYAPGVDMTTRTRTWSTAKSIASTLIGMLVDEGKLALDEPLGYDFFPTAATGRDPRAAITLRHVLNMSSGLEPVDNGGREYAIGSGLSYWAGASSVVGARSRALIREPGSNWDYENYDTLLGIYAMKRALGGEQAYAEFPRRRLLDRIGMRNTLVSTDRFGDFILSSQVYTNARDLARFGLLYLQGGIWNGERLV